jgi:hypothetical protein
MTDKGKKRTKNLQKNISQCILSPKTQQMHHTKII